LTSAHPTKKTAKKVECQEERGGRSRKQCGIDLSQRYKPKRGLRQTGVPHWEEEKSEERIITRLVAKREI